MEIMRKTCLFIGAVLASLISFSGLTHGFKQHSVFIDHPWARPTFALAKTGAVYLNLHNKKAQPEQLLSVSVSPEIAARIEIHDTVQKGEMMSMQEQTLPIELDGDSQVDFKPGGMHIMLLGLVKPLKDGERFPLTLTFAQAGQIEVEVKIEMPTTDEHASGHHGHH